MICRLTALLIVFVLPCGGGLAIAEDSEESSSRAVGRIDYHFVGHREETDDTGRLLVWQAEFHGTLSGTMKWWFDVPPPVEEVAITGRRVSFYSARWELWSNGVLLLAGESAGKTVFADGGDGVWDGHGVVTEAADGHAELLGRRVYETGPVLVGSEPPVSFSGTGLFVVF
jgi:hypothetical protein